RRVVRGHLARLHAGRQTQAQQTGGHESLLGNSGVTPEAPTRPYLFLHAHGFGTTAMLGGTPDSVARPESSKGVGVTARPSKTPGVPPRTNRARRGLSTPGTPPGRGGRPRRNL